MITSSKLMSRRLTAQSGIVSSYVSDTPSSFCSIANFSTELLADNASGGFNQETGVLTVTGLGGGGNGTYFAGAMSDGWTSATGEVCFALGLTTTSGATGHISLFFSHAAMSTIAGAQALLASNKMFDGITEVQADGGGDISPVVAGTYWVGIKLNQAAGTASWKDTNGNTGTLTVAGTYNNANPVYMIIGAQVGNNGSKTITVNTGNAAWPTGLEDFLTDAYCAYT
jgi:hypothetical protein